MRRATVWIYLSVTMALVFWVGAQSTAGPSAWIDSQDPRTGTVVINGVDMGSWNGVPRWDFGDGTVVDGGFPQEHTYTDFGRNYVVKLHVIYNDGSSADAEVPVDFVTFDFKDELFGTPKTVSVFVESVDLSTGHVVINGVDMTPTVAPFTWDFGDGTVLDGWFPQEHTYTDVTRNYIVQVTAHYAEDRTASASGLIRFAAPALDPISLPEQYQVTIPATAPLLDSHMPGYSAPETLTGFSDADFGVSPRSSMEYVLSACGAVQSDFVNGDLPDFDGGFRQVALKDTSGGAWMYSLWFTTPPSFAAASEVMTGSIPYSSFFHELGHNASLNTPASFFYGGKIDGPANMIYSETMGQIFQFSTAYQLINSAAYYGLSDDLRQEIAQSSREAIHWLRATADTYVDEGAHFRSWNIDDDPWAGYTYAVIAYKFCSHAEQAGLGYRAPLKRMMSLLQQFDTDMEAKYDRWNDTPEADAFRATLMVAALSYAFRADLRGEFRDLSFPIDDLTFFDLIARVQPPVSVTIDQASGQVDPTDGSPVNFTVVFSEPVSDFATGDVALSGTAGATTATVTGSGTTYNVAVSGMTAAGTVIASIPSGVAHDWAGNENLASTSTDNTVEFVVRRTIGASVTLKNWSAASPVTLPFQVRYRKSGASDTPTVVDLNLTVTPSGGTGATAFSLTGLAPDTYDVWVKCSHWLAAKLTGIDVTASDSTGNSFALTNADINGDNTVSFSDYLVLQTQYKKTPGTPTADVNGDVKVDFSDYLILQTAYKQSGAVL